MPTSPDRIRILIIEDDARTARTLGRMLEEDGYEVEVVFDGAAAIGRLGRDPLPQVIIVDYRLPHIDGMAVAGYARSRDATLPVVFVTSYQEIVRQIEPHLDPPPILLPKPLAYADLTRELSRIRDAA